MVGNQLINHLMYADDLISMSPYSAGLQQLLRVYTKYGLQFDIKFNPKKSVIMTARTKEDQKLKFPYFYLSEQELDIVTKVKYLGHTIRNDLNDDDDIQCQCYKYAQTNMLARKFHMCTEVKTALFKVEYNALRIMLKYPRWESSSKMFVNCNVPTFQALLRNFIYTFMCRLIESRNGIIMCLTDPKWDNIFLQPLEILELSCVCFLSTEHQC